MSPFRLDRLLTLYFFHPLLRAISFHKKARIPILMYHSISNDNESNVHPYYRINTSPDVFAKHINFLHENNYKVIGLDQAVKTLKSPDTNFPDHRTTYATQKTQVTQQTLLPNRPNEPNKPNEPIFVVLTFDDGYQDFYTEAFPVLQNYDYTATVFLPTGFIDNRKNLKGKNHLNWNEILELSDKGITFGSHTVTHPQLKFLKKEDIEFEIRQSKEEIENNLEKPVESFSYPFAFPEEDKEFTKHLKEILQKYGYKYGVSTRIGMTSKRDDIYFMKRIPVNSCDDIRFFEAKLKGGYDWLSAPQNWVKILKYKAGDGDSNV